MFGGCADIHHPVETTSVDSVSTSKPENNDPPCVILFDSEEDFLQLKQALLLSDEEINNLDLDSFIQCIDGQSQREQLENLISIVEKVGPMLPRISDTQTQYADFKIYPHTQQFALMYQLHSGQRYMITLSPKDDHITTVNGELSVTPVYFEQKIGLYTFDLYEYDHLGIRKYYYGEYIVNNFVVSVLIDPPKDNSAFVFDEFYFERSHIN